MAVHLLKMAVGAADVDDVAGFQRRKLQTVAGRTVVCTQTRHMPRRRDEVLDGGSIYWIIKGAIRVRQRVLDLVEARDDEGRPCCRLVLDPALAATEPMPRRPMQGWRYLAVADAPADLANDATGDALPAQLIGELRALGLW